MRRAFYESSVFDFLRQSETSILGELARNNAFTLEDTQRNAWLEEIRIFKRVLQEFCGGYIALEYTIPRIGSRIDAVLIIDGFIFLLEFKVGARDYHHSDIIQVTDYALDLKNFHKESHSRLLIPILIATRAPSVESYCSLMKEGIMNVIRCNASNIHYAIRLIMSRFKVPLLDAQKWMTSPYTPTPTIIEAAQALYRGHHVSDISRNDASAINLNITTAAINTVIDKSKREKRKSICFITGVPGAGKTLAGLNIANERHKFDENEHAVFLSGNQPLVSVLQEALARDEHKRHDIKKTEALSKAKAFIQIIHHFRDDCILTQNAPIEKVAIFDEAQRAWNESMLADFMAKKKGHPNFFMSEPEFLISVMDRHKDWSVIVCLIGGGQEINTGEAGLTEWFNALRKRFSHWDVYVSNKITDHEYTRGLVLRELLKDLKYTIVEQLHLSVSLRSFRSENVAGFVKSLLDGNVANARELYHKLSNQYPIVLTRDFSKAKTWIKQRAKGSERYGVIASSGARRLRTFGIWVQNKVDATSWFLNDENDVRSSFFLEETATEFDIQGLELDWSIVCWDANFRFSQGGFEPYSFYGTKWMNINNKDDILYLVNAYRVLLTRARQGMIIFLPHGDNLDNTRKPEYYDGTYSYLKSLGLSEI